MTDLELLRRCRSLLSTAVEGLECDSEREREHIYYEVVDSKTLEIIDNRLSENN